MVEPLLEREILECPKCHKKGLVRCVHETDDVFQCVYCDYRHDLTQSSQLAFSQKGAGNFLLAFVLLLLLILTLGGL